MNKTCTKCNLNKDESLFHVNSRNTLLKQSWCKQCNHEQTIARQRNIKKNAVEYKGNKCEDCNLVAHPCIYDFHHNDPDEKDFGISKFKNTKWNAKNTGRIR